MAGETSRVGGDVVIGRELLQTAGRVTGDALGQVVERVGHRPRLDGSRGVRLVAGGAVCANVVAVDRYLWERRRAPLSQGMAFDALGACRCRQHRDHPVNWAWVVDRWNVAGLTQEGLVARAGRLCGGIAMAPATVAGHVRRGLDRP